ncbi:MAG: hypothetical protein KGJ07_03970 [Patescibacteria group bacterium]|nr:hypothetical protein [Patescibacteria group bacterium]
MKMSTSITADIPAVLPAELQYDDLRTWVAGLVTRQYRVQNSGAINGNISIASGSFQTTAPGAGTTPNTVVQIQIPAQAMTFLDPSTHYLNVRGYLQLTYSKAEGNTLAQAPHILRNVPNGTCALIGSSWSLFNQLITQGLNSLQLDQIQEVGILALNMFKFDYNVAERQLMAPCLGFACSNPGTLSSCFILNSNPIGSTIAGDPGLIALNNGYTGASSVASTDSFYAGGGGWFLAGASFGAATSAANSNQWDYSFMGTTSDSTISSSMVGYRFDTSNFYGNDCGPSFSSDAKNAAANSWTSMVIDFQCPMIGCLGAGNDKLYPMWLGPTTIQLTTENNTVAFQQCQNLQIQAPQGSVTGANNIQPQTVTAAFVYQTVESVFDAVSVYSDTLQSILELPAAQGRMPGIFRVRCISWILNTYTIPAGTSGQFDCQITSRRSSNKFYLVTFNPQNYSQYVVYGAGGGLNVTNGALYNTTRYGKFESACPNLASNTGAFINNDLYPYQGLDCKNKPNDALYQTLKTMNVATNRGEKPCFNPSSWFVSDYNRYVQNTTTGITNMSVYNPYWRPISVDINSALMGITTLWGSGMTKTSPGLVGSNKFENGFFLCIDTETFSKRANISGISTLFGNNLLRLRIDSCYSQNGGTTWTGSLAGLSCSYMAYIYACYDCILEFNSMDNTMHITT